MKISKVRALSCILLVGVCGCSVDSTPSQVDVAFPHTNLVLADYPTALLDGTLSIEVTEDAYCPRVVDANGNSYLLVLPPTADVSVEAVSVGAQVYGIGTISMGGGVMGIDFDDVGCSGETSAWLVAP